MAQRLKGYIEREPRLKLIGDTNVSLVCFRVKVGNLSLYDLTTYPRQRLQKDSEDLSNKATLE